MGRGQIAIWLLLSLALESCAVSKAAQSSSCGTAVCRPVSRQVDMRLRPAHGRVQVLVEPNDGPIEVAKAIDGAQHTVLVSAYILSDHRIVRALERAAAEGVGVYVLLEKSPFGLIDQPQTMYSELAAAGIHVEWAPSYFTYAHSKFMVLDDAVLILSSANFSESGFTSDRDFVVVDDNPLDVREADNIFRADWDRIAPVLNDPDLLVSPSNSRRKLYQLLAGARHTVDIYSEEVLDPGIVKRVTALAKRGVRVRILAATVSSSARQTLQRSGAQIGSSGVGNLYIHAKAIVVDNRLVFIGSENFSSTSLDDDRELGIVTRYPEAVQTVERAFSKDWNAHPH